jgi:hypothetical protein
MVLVGDQTTLIEGIRGELSALNGGHKRASEYLRGGIVENFPAGP